ncbi:MAG: SET domain-containing protein [Candidatus Omnitrophica bacterium]|nr:SET domain-containing protein [Candidatus Omnitrophota bacterium]MCM8793132.1 SET domain-containing protein [Candidatus Omnitrophota bacterium]
MLKHSYVINKAEVSKSVISGKGVFAKELIKKGEIIAVWGGDIVTERQLREISKKGFPKIYHYATQIADGFFLVSDRKGRFLEDDDYFNHSCQPNAGIKGHLVMVAMRNIKPGEEITYDYAMTDAGFRYRFKCSCGSRHCRKIITSEDWKKTYLQKKYRNFFSWFVQEKIKKLRKKYR